MYEQFYCLTGKPFSLLPDADLLYLGQSHQRALNLLEYGMISQAGFIIISGEVGLGKTTLIRRFLKTADENTNIGVITTVSNSFGRLLNWVAAAFGLDYKGRDNLRLYNSFLTFLLEQYATGKRVVLIVDEAQNFKPETLEELRMLSNVNMKRISCCRSFWSGSRNYWILYVSRNSGNSFSALPFIVTWKRLAPSRLGIISIFD